MVGLLLLPTFGNPIFGENMDINKRRLLSLGIKKNIFELTYYYHFVHDTFSGVLCVEGGVR